MKKNSKSIIPGIIIIAICIIALFLIGSISSAILRTVLMIILIAAIVIILLMILIVVFARGAGNKSAAPNASVNNKNPLTPEQSESLKKAGSELTKIRMTLSRIKDKSIADAGADACNSIDKVLQALKEKPEKIQTTRQLFNYYIPTMEKVLSKYQKIEESGVSNTDMPDSLKKYLSDIKEAMDNMYEGLYDNDKLNVSVDMEAMTMAIKRDGLLDDEDFKM